MNKNIVLNVGGGASRHLPPRYKGWEQHLLDIDPSVGADIVCDAKELNIFDKYDSVYSSHTLEHFYKHEVPVVLKNMFNCLKKGGDVEIHVPDLRDLLLKWCNTSLDIHDVYYRLSDGTPITYHDVIYGWNYAMEGGNLYYSHKCGFTSLSLSFYLQQAGFSSVSVITETGNLMGVGTK
jgi:hypothetical protein